MSSYSDIASFLNSRMKSLDLLIYLTSILFRNPITIIYNNSWLFFWYYSPNVRI